MLGSALWSNHGPAVGFGFIVTICGVALGLLGIGMIGLRTQHAARSARHYGRLTSERTIELREATRPSGRRQPLAATDVDRVLVVALGDRADDPALIDFVTDDTVRAVLLTDRADVVPAIARSAEVEYLPVAADASIDTRLAVALERVLVLMSEDAAPAEVTVWPEHGRPIDGEAGRQLDYGRSDVLSAVLRTDSLLAAQASRLDELQDLQTRRQERMDAFVSSLSDMAIESEQMHRQATNAIDSAMKSGYHRLEALNRIEKALGTPKPLPPIRDWSLLPDLAADLIERIHRREIRNILEVGSGSSTVLFAMAFAAVGDGCVHALEHDPEYAARTQALLQEHGVVDYATVLHAPLAACALDGHTTEWYGIEALDLPTGVDLLLVDGPPESTGPEARYPAVPMLADRLATGAMIVLDDGYRPAERRIAERWAERDDIVSKKALRFERTPIAFEFRRPS